MTWSRQNERGCSPTIRPSALAILVSDRKRHYRVEVAVESGQIGSASLLGHVLASFGNDESSQKQPLHARSENCIAGFDRVSTASKLVRQTNLPSLGMALLGPIQIGSAGLWPSRTSSTTTRARLRRIRLLWLKNGLHTLGILHEKTLPFSPWANGKQEAIWGNVEGRLIAMLEGVRELTLEAPPSRHRPPLARRNVVPFDDELPTPEPRRSMTGHPGRRATSGLVGPGWLALFATALWSSALPDLRPRLSARTLAAMPP
jgi:hypothetical protein